MFESPRKLVVISPKLSLTSASGERFSSAWLSALFDGLSCVVFVLSVVLPLQAAHWQLFVCGMSLLIPLSEFVRSSS